MRFSELEAKNVGVWGVGRETRSFAAQLRSRLPQARIAALASDDEVDGETLTELAIDESQVAKGEEIPAALAECDVVIRSPGVSRYRPELRELHSRGTPVTTATALWLAEVAGSPVIGVTGTKGKSTTAMLTAHLARATGATVELAGNIGAPALDLLDKPQPDLVVLELSSYQIADMATGPALAVVTNLHREHVDWHGSDAGYRADKLRILGLPGVRTTVLNGRDDALCAAAESAVAPHFFGTPDGWDTTAAGIAFDGELVVAAKDLPLRGEHNALNLCAALTALDVMGIARAALPDALQGIASLPHRLEVVAEQEGVTWIDDGISTTPESTLAALASFPGRRIVLLGGGQDRDQDFAALGQALAEREAVVVGLPTTGSRLIDAARQAGLAEDRAVEVADMESAVSVARELARSGDAVLLSPAAPSYNAYRNFEERSRHFRALL